MIIQIAFWINVFWIAIMFMVVGINMQKKDGDGVATSLLQTAIYCFIGYALWTVYP